MLVRCALVNDTIVVYDDTDTVIMKATPKMAVSYASFPNMLYVLSVLFLLCSSPDHTVYQEMLSKEMKYTQPVDVFLEKMLAHLERKENCYAGS